VLATCRHHPALTASDELLAAHIRDHGATVEALAWDDIVPADLGDAVVCLRSTWDYHKRSDEFRAWIGALRAHRARVVNPAATVLWNMDKEYLGWLEAHGIAIPATRWIAPGESFDLPALLAIAGWDRAVLKPRISATAYGTHLVTAGSVLGTGERKALERSGALLQAFVPEIQSAGETSLIFVDGCFSHAVRKLPSPGDFRVQHEFGGTVGPVDAGDALRDFGARVLATTPHEWTYARVDVVDTARGPLLMELELIEPDLFLTSGADAAARLATALLRAGSRLEG
jgi:hypothetical protein